MAARRGRRRVGCKSTKRAAQNCATLHKFAGVHTRGDHVGKKCGGYRPKGGGRLRRRCIGKSRKDHDYKP